MQQGDCIVAILEILEGVATQPWSQHQNQNLTDKNLKESQIEKEF